MLPLFHVFGLSSILNAGVRFGGTIVLVPRFEVGPVLDAMERHRITLFLGVPTMYVALLQADTTRGDLSSLRVGISGGAAIPGEVIRAFEEKFPGVVILEGYGLSEIGEHATFNDSAENRRVLSIGQGRCGASRCRWSTSEGRPLPRGEDHIGEIVIRGHNIMKGYYRRPEATAEAMRSGWFHTGDLGYRDEDGYLFIVDRVKDLIIRGGYNVYPREIEEVLYAHPAIAEAAVIGTARRPARRGGGGRGQPQARRGRRRRTSSSRSARSSWPPTSTPARSGSCTSCRRDPPGRSSRPSCGTDLHRLRRGRGDLSALRDDWLEPRPDRLDDRAPDRDEILAAHRSAIEAGEEGCIDPRTGLFVLTAGYLAERGYCCDQGCRHCPYERP